MEMQDKNIAKTGNRGRSAKSDCYVELEIKTRGGIEIEMKSKVETMFGKANRKLIREVLAFFKIQHAYVFMDDAGALPFVITARLEAAIKMLIKTPKEYLAPLLPQNTSTSLCDQFRFSRLYLPGNSPKLMINAGIHQPNGLILDLEDAVAPDKKHEARFVVRNALRQLNFYGAERMVRINQAPMGLIDLEYLIPHHVNIILIPKCESAEHIHQVNEKINQLKKEHQLDYNIWLMPIIESALGVIKAFEIASAASNVVAMAIGLEDYTADIGSQRTNEGSESFFARSMVVNAAKAAGIQPIDSVFSDVADMEALKVNVQRSKALGFEGMGCIHPRQIRVIHENFAPEKTEIEKATKIVHAYLNARDKGLGVVSLGSKMIDAPVVKRAQKTVDLALSLHLIDANWREALSE